MRTTSPERFYPSVYGWIWNANTQSGYNLAGLNGTWHIIALRADATSLKSYTSVVSNAVYNPLGPWQTTTIPTSPANYVTSHC
jgi:hypothetical protein